MALEVSIGNKQFSKYNPYSPYLNYGGATKVWAALEAGETQPVCPSAVSSGDDITIIRGHMDSYLQYAYSRRAEMRIKNEDPDFFAFPTYIVPPSNPIHLFADTYDNSLMIMYLLARADDEYADKPRAACYLSSAVAIAKTFLRRMEEGGYTVGLSSPPLRLGTTYEGLYARYPLGAALDSAAGDLGHNACALSTDATQSLGPSRSHSGSHF